MNNISSKKIRFFLTGFGEFYGVLENPTQKFIESLTEKEKNDLQIQDAQVLEVSIEGVEKYIDYVQNTLKTEQTNNEQTTTIFIHFGVDDSSSCFTLEYQGYNQKHFSCPDMRNNTPQNQKIHEDFQLDHDLKSELKLHDIQQLAIYKAENITEQNQSVYQIGTDPGRYICNYIYFRSLHSLQNNKIQNEFNKCLSLFVHCPPFRKINQEQQKKLMISLIESISIQYS